MKIIYWNTKKAEDLNRILELLIQESPNILFLAEVTPDLLTQKENEQKLKNAGYEYFENPGCERIQIISRIDLNINLSIQNKYYTSIKVDDISTYIISVHLPSQMFQHIDGLKKVIRNLRNTIDLSLGNSLEKRILFIGDFNVNPFEKPMIDFDGFAATNSINYRKKITHLGESLNPYYNVTWRLYSREYFPGTKFFQRPSASSFDILEFHYLDQVIISHKLKEELMKDQISIIEKTENFSFFDIDKNRIEGSDHSPIMYEFKIA